MFKGIVVEKDAEGYRASLAEIDENRLPAGDVTVRVDSVSYTHLTLPTILRV